MVLHRSDYAGTVLGVVAAALLCVPGAAWAQGFSNPLSIVIPLPKAAAPPAPAVAQAGPVTVGLLLTLSGPDAEPGKHARDGFTLALKQRGGMLGGRTVKLVTVDDQMQPNTAAAKAIQLVQQDGATFIVGPVFDRVLDAMAKPAIDAGAIIISPSAGTAAMAGKGCSPSFFTTGYEKTQIDEMLGLVAQNTAMKRAALIAPNDQAGKDATAAFRSRFEGEVVDETAVPSAQQDFAPDLARIAASKPDVVFAFMPGQQGVALVRQYRQSGVATVPLLTAFTVDETTLPAQQTAAAGLFAGMNWAADIGTPANAEFMTAFEAAYHYVPSVYAMNGYDAAQMIDSALRKTAAKPADKAALRTALRDADFKSPRGPFRFNVNGFPIQDFYLVQVAQRPDGKLQTRIRQRVLTDAADRFAADCPLK